MEGLEDLWIKIEDQILLLGERHVPAGHGIGYPLCKRSAYDCIRDVHYPLVGHHVHIPLVGQVLEYALVLTGLLEDVVDGQPLVLGTSEELHFVARDEGLLL